MGVKQGALQLCASPGDAVRAEVAERSRYRGTSRLVPCGAGVQALGKSLIAASSSQASAQLAVSSPPRCIWYSRTAEGRIQAVLEGAELCLIPVRDGA